MRHLASHTRVALRAVSTAVTKRPETITTAVIRRSKAYDRVSPQARSPERASQRAVVRRHRLLGQPGLTAVRSHQPRTRKQSKSPASSRAASAAPRRRSRPSSSHSLACRSTTDARDTNTGGSRWGAFIRSRQTAVRLTALPTQLNEPIPCPMSHAPYPISHIPQTTFEFRRISPQHEQIYCPHDHRLDCLRVCCFSVVRCNQ